MQKLHRVVVVAATSDKNSNPSAADGCRIQGKHSKDFLL